MAADLARVAQPGGWVVLDYLHASRRKTITIGDLGRTFVERVRLFEASELTTPCTSEGLVVGPMVGDCDRSSSRDDSPHTIRVARRR